MPCINATIPCRASRVPAGRLRFYHVEYFLARWSAWPLKLLDTSHELEIGFILKIEKREAPILYAMCRAVWAAKQTSARAKKYST